MVRFGTAEDFASIYNIRMQLHSLHVDARPDIYKMPEREAEFHQILQEAVEGKDCRLFVCENDFCIAGYALVRYTHCENACMKQDRRTLFIDEIAVEKTLRGQGYGRELMDGLVSFAREHHMDSVDLAVWNFNEEAMHFYESFGMTPKYTLLELPCNP